MWGGGRTVTADLHRDTDRRKAHYKLQNYKVRVLAAPVPKSQIGSEGLRSPENVALRTKPERKLGNCNLDNITTDASPQ